MTAPAQPAVGPAPLMRLTDDSAGTRPALRRLPAVLARISRLAWHADRPAAITVLTARTAAAVALAELVTTRRLTAAAAGTAVFALTTLTRTAARVLRTALFVDYWATFLEDAARHRTHRGTTPPARRRTGRHQRPQPHLHLPRQRPARRRRR
ncbi:hypothetical protein [Streptomyces sp. NPDC047061]|uniref:hypothetical protein n=1 Tax=Streptomyces sp. NPDC047061 TaxID=3154605 RepID=UPI0033F3EBE5